MFCPACTAVVELDTDCPGYGDKPVMTCYPSCGNMDVAECECGWHWTSIASKRQSYAGWSENAPPIGWQQPVEPILNLARRGAGQVTLRAIITEVREGRPSDLSDEG